MKQDPGTDLHQEWEQRWHGSDQSERLTWLGKLMFRSKIRALTEVVGGLDISSLVEVGCGLGYTLSVYQKLGISCLGIDISPSAIEVCENKGLTVRLQNLEDVEESFDLVSSDGMLEHFLNFEPHAVRLMEISKRYVLLIQPNHESFVGKTLVYLAELLRGRENVFEYNYRMQDFAGVFARNGFVLKTSRPIFADTFRLLLFEKQN